MSRYGLSEWVVAAGIVAVAAVPSEVATGAVGGAETQKLAEAVVGPQHMPGGAADLEVRYIQEDGPESGHVLVVLTPEARPLKMFEARTAAQQAYLEALSEPGLGSELRRIVVVVLLMPASNPYQAGAEQTFLFLRKDSETWSILGGE